MGSDERGKKERSSRGNKKCYVSSFTFTKKEVNNEVITR